MKKTIDMGGPYSILHRGKTERVCYIVRALESGACLVWEPEIRINGEILSEQWELAKEIKTKNTFEPTGKFKSWGKDNYFN